MVPKRRRSCRAVDPGHRGLGLVRKVPTRRVGAVGGLAGRRRAEVHREVRCDYDPRDGSTIGVSRGEVGGEPGELPGVQPDGAGRRLRGVEIKPDKMYEPDVDAEVARSARRARAVRRGPEERSLGQ